MRWGRVWAIGNHIPQSATSDDGNLSRQGLHFGVTGGV
jgi:hypothetical protein